MTIHITTHDKKHKLSGFISLNTSPACNPFCQTMAKTETICAHCYAINYEKRYKNLASCLARNSSILSTAPLDLSTIADLEKTFRNYRAIRFNSFGELINQQHLDNLFSIANHFPTITFTLWTKRKNLDFTDCPDNTILIYSSPVINKQSSLPDHFHKVFTVYEKSFPIPRNCTGSCITCQLCYTHNNITHISETLR